MANNFENVTMSKFLSLLLRHHPEYMDLTMDEEGWVNVRELLDKINQDRAERLSWSRLHNIVNNDSKHRFELKREDGYEYIRAQYGHSLPVHLGHEELEPPEFLYHGTATKHIEGIQKHGILPMDRQFVHLTENKKVAISTGARHGSPVVLKVAAKKLYNQKHTVFYKAPNGVWLTRYVDKDFFTKEKIETL